MTYHQVREPQRLLAVLGVCMRVAKLVYPSEDGAGCDVKDFCDSMHQSPPLTVNFSEKYEKLLGCYRKFVLKSKTVLEKMLDKHGNFCYSPCHLGSFLIQNLTREATVQNAHIDVNKEINYV